MLVGTLSRCPAPVWRMDGRRRGLCAGFFTACALRSCLSCGGIKWERWSGRGLLGRTAKPRQASSLCFSWLNVKAIQALRRVADPARRAAADPRGDVVRPPPPLRPTGR